MATEGTREHDEEAAPEGPVVYLHNYFTGMRHWVGMSADGQPLRVVEEFEEVTPEGTRRRLASTLNDSIRPAREQFLELEREGIAGLFRVLNELARELYPIGHVMQQRANPHNRVTLGLLHDEQRIRETAWNINTGAMRPNPGNLFTVAQLQRHTNYGECNKRAQRQMNYTVKVPHVLTEEEARAIMKEQPERRVSAGDTDEPRAPEQTKEGPPNAVWQHWAEVLGLDVRGPELRNLLHHARATAEQVGRRWAEVYAAEVKLLLGDEPDAERVAAFGTLCANLKVPVIGTAEGRAAWERMKEETEGQQVLAAFDRVTGYLSTLLFQLAEEYPAEEPAMNEQRLTWLGEKGELAALIMELEAHGWIRRGGSWAKFAERVWSVFQDEQGQPLDLPTMKQYIKPSGNYRTRQENPFEVSDHPDK